MKKITVEKMNAVIKSIQDGLTIKESCVVANISYLPLIDYKKYLAIKNDAEADLYAELKAYLNIFYTAR